MTDEEVTYPKKAKPKRGWKCGRTRAKQTSQTSPRNNIRIIQSVQPANEQQAEGSHPPSLQPPCREENLLLSKKEESAGKEKDEETPPTSPLKPPKGSPTNYHGAKHIVALFCISHALFLTVFNDKEVIRAGC